MAFADLSAPVTAYVALGSNLGNREDHLRGAVAALQATPGVVAVRLSQVYETEAVDCAEPLAFLNAVAAVDTRLSVTCFFDRLMEIEQDFVRQRVYRNAPRTLDLDLLAFGAYQSHSEKLTVPHPRLHTRLFVCVPFVDVAPEWVHPTRGKSLSEIVQELRESAGCMGEPRVVKGFLRDEGVYS